MALHAKLTKRTGVAVYICDPHSSWQRGICENTNGFLRQYLPKGTDLSVYSQQELDVIRRQLEYQTPRHSRLENAPERPLTCWPCSISRPPQFNKQVLRLGLETTRIIG